jgi:hypothetical protein
MSAMNWSIAERNNENIRMKIWGAIVDKGNTPLERAPERKSYDEPGVFSLELWVKSAFGRMIGSSMLHPDAQDNNALRSLGVNLARRGLADDFLTAVLEEAWPNEALRFSFLESCQDFLAPDAGRARAASLSAALDLVRPRGFHVDKEEGETPKPEKGMILNLVNLAEEIGAFSTTARLALATEDVLSAADMVAGQQAAGLLDDGLAAATKVLQNSVASLSATKLAVDQALKSASEAVYTPPDAAEARAILRLLKAYETLDSYVGSIATAPLPDPGDPTLAFIKSKCGLLLEELSEVQHLAMSELRFKDVFDTLRDYLRLLDARADTWYVHLRALVIDLRRSILTQALWREVDSDMELITSMGSGFGVEGAMRPKAAVHINKRAYDLESMLKWLDLGASSTGVRSWQVPLRALQAGLAAVGGAQSAGATATPPPGQVVDWYAQASLALATALRFESRAAIRKTAAVIEELEELATALRRLVQRIQEWDL